MLNPKASNSSSSSSSFYGSTAEPDQEESAPPPSHPALGVYTRFDTNDVSSLRSRSHQLGRGLKVILFILFTFAAFVTLALVLQIHFYGGSKRGALSAVEKTIADDIRCSELGNEVLRRGGNALDAVVSSTICASLVAPHLSGIGGGGFILLHDRRANSSTLIDFRESAPASPHSGSRDEGFHSIGVPGFLKGLEMALEEFGSGGECCSWKSLVHLALNAVRREFLITESFKNASINKVSFEKDAGEMANLRSFIRPNQKMIPGEVHDSKLFNRLIQAYALIASNGSDAFYNGPLGERLIKETSGQINLEDLKSYKVFKREPISTIIGNKYRIVASGPPSSGPKLIAAFNAVYALKNERGVDLLTWDYFKKIIKAADRLDKLQYDLGDPIDPRVRDVEQKLLSKEVSELLMSDMHDSEEYGDSTRRVNTGTNVAAMDSKDLYVSAFTSLNSHFGSKVMTSDGIILNNALSNFDDPSLNSVNVMEKGRRPSTSAVVAIVLDNEDVCGTRIAIGGADSFNVAKILSNSLVYDVSLKTSLTLPRIYVNNGTTGFEMAFEGIDPHILKEYSRNNPYYLQHLPYNTINLINKTLDVVSPLRDPRSGKSL